MAAELDGHKLGSGISGDTMQFAWLVLRGRDVQMRSLVEDTRYTLLNCRCEVLA